MRLELINTPQNAFLQMLPNKIREGQRRHPSDRGDTAF